MRTCTVSAEEFIRRFLQQVLPDGFVKVRYYGLVSPTNRDLLERARQQLTASRMEEEPSQKDSIVKQRSETLRCPRCGREMRLVERVKPNSREPP
jgi:hypothetical protein